MESIQNKHNSIDMGHLTTQTLPPSLSHKHINCSLSYHG